MTTTPMVSRDVKDMPWKYQIIQPGMDFPNLFDINTICVDVETKPRPDFMSRDKAGLDPHRAELLGLCLGAPGASWYLPMRHRAPGSEAWNLDPSSCMEYLRDVLKNKKVVVNQNLKFDAKMLKVNGGDTANNVDLLRDAPEAVFFDTMIASQLIDERWPTHSLKPVCEAVLGIPAVEERLLKNYTRDAGQKKDRLDYSVVPADLMGRYGCKDGELPLRLMAWQYGELDRQQLWEPFRLEMRTLRTLIKCETQGFRVDLERLALDYLFISRRAEALEQELEKEAGTSFNPNSADEIADIVDTLFGLKVKKVWDKKNKRMKPKVDDPILQEYIHDYPERAPFFFKIRMVRRLRHLLSSFIESYRYHHVNGIIYPNFMQLSPNSGTRMTSSSPNVQQVSSVKEWYVPDNFTPNKLEEPETYINNEGVRCWRALGARQYFIPRQGHALLFFDQSQIEYRLFAHYANNARMVNAYRNNPDMDLHEWARTEIFKSKIKRRPAKNVHFGIVYGMGKNKTVKSMQVAGARVTDAEGAEMLDSYHSQVPEVKQLTHGDGGMGETLKRRGYLCSILGGRRRIANNWNLSREEKEELEDGGESDKGALPYQALNVCCQRSSMDVLKFTMNNADQAGYTTTTPIHDELIFEPKIEQAEDWAAKLKGILQQFNKPDGTPYLRVPIYVAGKYAPVRWSEAEEIEFE